MLLNDGEGPLTANLLFWQSAVSIPVFVKGDFEMYALRLTTTKTLGKTFSNATPFFRIAGCPFFLLGYPSLEHVR